MAEVDMCGSFRIGDLVAASHDEIDYNREIKAGMVGVVVDIQVGAYHPVGVQWETDVGGHTCNGQCPYDFGWYARPEDLVLVKNTVQDISAEELSSLLCEVV